MTCRPHHGDKFEINNQEDYDRAIKDVRYIKAFMGQEEMTTPEFHHELSA